MGQNVPLTYGVCAIIHLWGRTTVAAGTVYQCTNQFLSDEACYTFTCNSTIHISATKIKYIATVCSICTHTNICLSVSVYVIVVTWALVICLICMPKTQGPQARGLRAYISGKVCVCVCVCVCVSVCA